MLIESQVKSRVESALGGPMERIAPVFGGDINEAFSFEIEGRGAFFLKFNSQAPAGMFAREAEGLEFLREADSGLVVPRVFVQTESCLVLQFLRPSGGDRSAELGRGLARLHRSEPRGFGLGCDNFIGTLPQNNTTSADWVSFFREQRLAAQLALPGARRAYSAAQRKVFDRLLDRLDQLLGPPEPPARLHGDLWGGNWMACDEGAAIFDPAVYGGHREVDLAMMQLFGGFSPATFAAYDEVYPRAPEAEERVRLYQLYPLLVHANLFGGGYASSAFAIAREFT